MKKLINRVMRKLGYVNMQELLGILKDLKDEDVAPAKPKRKPTVAKATTRKPAAKKAATKR